MSSIQQAFLGAHSRGNTVFPYFLVERLPASAEHRHPGNIFPIYQATEKRTLNFSLSLFFLVDLFHCCPKVKKDVGTSYQICAATKNHPLVLKRSVDELLCTL